MTPEERRARTETVAQQDGMSEAAVFRHLAARNISFAVIGARAIVVRIERAGDRRMDIVAG